MARALDRLGLFQPRRLHAIRLQTQEDHPSTASRPASVASHVTQRVRLQVEKAAGDPEHLRNLARRFSPSEMRACVTGVENWEALRPALSTVIRARPLGTTVSALWRSWQRLPSLDLLGELLLDIGEARGMARAVGSRYADDAPQWISASPGAAIAAWLDDRGWSYSDLPRLPDSPFSADTPLLRLVRNAVMTQGSTAQLRAEGTERLLSWFEELGPNDRMEFERNYLHRFESAEWKPTVLELIHDRHGLPRRPLRPAFWDPVSQPIKDKFQRIVIDRILSEAFGDDTDRHVYWRRAVETHGPRNLTKGKAGSTDYVAIDFGGFVVVEFFQIGNAAYFYSQEQFQQVRRGSVRHPSSLKTKHQSPRGRRRDNRLIHSGSWQWKADRMLSTWAEAYR